MPEFIFSTAVRKSVPMIMSLSGTSGSGKTFSGLLLAAGLAGSGKVGMLDTENGRGSMYADSPGIVKAFPAGFAITQLDPPFTPARYIEAITAGEKAGLSVLLTDSGTHEWEGIGGCCDIAENNKLKGMPNWAKAKMEHKKFMNHLLSSPMHIVFCLRARDKVKFIKVNGKDEIEPIGIQPIAEKNFVFEMLLSLGLDEKTHFASPIKLPQPLQGMFPATGRLLTSADGEAIRVWNQTGGASDPYEQLRKRARAAADEGMARYTDFFEQLNNAEKKALAHTTHGENKDIAAKADADHIPVEQEPAA